jgi:antirestriction protein
MYLPLTGFDKRTKIGEKMSINSIDPGLNPLLVKPLEKADRSGQETKEIADNNVKRKQEPEKVACKTDEKAVSGFYSANSMNTQDFLILKAQSVDEPYKILDEVIAKMKEEIEEIGEAMEMLAELAKKTSKSNLALQIIEKTMEAMEESEGKR